MHTHIHTHINIFAIVAVFTKISKCMNHVKNYYNVTVYMCMIILHQLLYVLSNTHTHTHFTNYDFILLHHNGDTNYFIVQVQGIQEEWLFYFTIILNIL